VSALTTAVSVVGLIVLGVCLMMATLDRRGRQAISLRAHGLVLAGFWPVLYLPAGVAGPATAGAACAVLLVCLFGRRDALACVDPITLILFGFLLLLVVRAEISRAEGISKELGFFFLACPPSLIIGFLCGRTGLLKGALWFTWPAIAVLGLLPPRLHPDINEIVVGHIAWMQIAAALTLRGTYLKILGILSGVYAFSLTPSLGPELSASAAVLWLAVFHRTAIRSHLPYWSRPLVGMAVLAFAIAGLRELVWELQSAAENSAAGVSVTARSTAWNRIISEPSLLGHGLAPIRSSEGQYLLGHAHNFLLGSLHATGLVGMSLVVWITIRALRGGTSKASTLDVPVAVGLIAAHLVSSDFYTAPLLWLSLGYLSSLRRRSAVPVSIDMVSVGAAPVTSHAQLGPRHLRSPQ
jgi:hypothetical protein